MKVPMKKTFITLLLFFFFFGQMLAQDKVKTAETAIKKKDYATAMQIAKEFLELDSADTALRILIKIESNNIVNKELYEMIGDTYSKQKVVENALLYYDKAAAIDSLDKNIKFKTAELLYKEKRYTESVNKYLNIVAIDSADTAALFKTANIFYLAGKADKSNYANSAIYFEKYFYYVKTNYDAYSKAAKTNIEIRNYQRAYDYANLASQKDKANKDIIKVLAVAAAWLGKYDESLSYYGQIDDSTLTKNDIKDLVVAGNNCEKSKKDSLALIYYGKVLSIDSTYKDVYWNVAILNYKLANYDTAIKFFDKYLAEKPNFELAIRFKAFAYLQKKDYNKTREYLLEAVALNDTIVDSYYWLAQSYKGVDSLGKAAEAMEKMISISEGKENLYKEKLLDAYGFLGQTAYDKKNYGKAISYLKKALSYNSKNVNYNLLVALAYHNTGDTNNAIIYYKIVISLDPNNEAAKKGLRLLSAD